MGLARGFDRTINKQLLLSLPMFEGTGTILTKDVAKPHHPTGMFGTPSWLRLASGIWVLSFNSAHPDYLQIPTASSADLRFTSGAFSEVVWFYSTALSSITNYYLNTVNDVSSNNGWYVLLRGDNKNISVMFRVGGAFAQTYTAINSITTVIWYCMGFSRISTSVRIYINGVDATSVAGSMTNPGALAQPFNFGYNTVQTVYPFAGYMWNPRIWSRTLAPSEHKEIFNRERHLFGV